MSHYQVARRVIIDLHRLASQGLEDTLEAEVIRERLDRPFLSMSEVELAEIGRFSDSLQEQATRPGRATS